MSWITGILVYLVLWWLVFFTALPWGVKRNESPEAGHDAGAPTQPRLWIKALVTSAIALVLLGLVWGLVESDLISFRRMEDNS